MASGVTKWVAVLVVWAVLIGLGVGAWFVLVEPGRRTAAGLAEARSDYVAVAEQARERGVDVQDVEEFEDAEAMTAATAALRRRLTGSQSPRITPGERTAVRLALDSFSGYAIFREPTFAADLAAGGVDLELVDDGADYAARIRSVESGETPMAVFTLDALLKASADLGDVPATVVMVIDESVGADAMVAREADVPTLDALGGDGAQVVLTPDSPSEALARVVLDTFAADGLSDDAFVEADGAADVLVRLRGGGGGPTAYVLWEPHLSRALEVDGVRVLLDSSRFRGFIVDVLVVNRDWLLANEPAVAEVVRAYQRAAYEARREGFERLLLADAKLTGEALTTEQAARIAKGVWWKTTRENYAHFGLEPSANLFTLDQMIAQIVRVLMRTGGLPSDPTNGDPGAIYYDGVMRSLQAANFHPGVISGSEENRPVTPPQPLSDEQWQELIPVGTLQTGRLVFFPGRPDLTPASERALEELAATLASFPQFYVRVIGGAGQRGNAEANRQLAEDRAEVAAAFLIKAGIDAARVRAVGSEPEAGGGRVVRFEVGQLAY
jgi:outer membrane protein OmpA-like peptidoglycan-associated protein/ABC-type nitrate/sulfonate/bicarbonate transport system substrate-binding protein